jgi:mRNA-degrading endonuclease toxin of MazEF toxin-antitoxin module
VRVGELYLVDFGAPNRGVEQANVRPAIVVHSDMIARPMA